MVRTGAAPTADLFTVEVLSLMEFHQQYTKAIEDSLKTRTLTKPDFLIDFKKWTQFAESWETYMKQLRGAAKCPLCYMFRVEESVTYLTLFLPFCLFAFVTNVDLQRKELAKRSQSISKTEANKDLL